MPRPKVLSAAAIEHYVGIPYRDKGLTLEGVNCWGLVRLIYFDVLGVVLPTYQAAYDNSDDEGIGGLIRRESRNWQAVGVKDARPMDLLCAWVKDRDRPPTHVGVCLGGGDMISARRPRVCVEPYLTGFWETRVVECYRHDSSLAGLRAGGA